MRHYGFGQSVPCITLWFWCFPGLPTMFPWSRRGLLWFQLLSATVLENLDSCFSSDSSRDSYYCYFPGVPSLQRLGAVCSKSTRNTLIYLRRRMGKFSSHTRIKTLCYPIAEPKNMVGCTMSDPKLDALHEYMQKNLAWGFIRKSTVPILFFQKKDGSLHLLVVY